MIQGFGGGREGERSFPPSHRPFAFSLYSTVGMGVSLLVRARCACRRLFQTEASLSMLSPRLASAAHPCTRPGCRLQHNRFPGQPCACVACLSASLLAQARGWYVPSGFSDCSAAGSAAPSRQTARCTGTRGSGDQSAAVKRTRPENTGSRAERQNAPYSAAEYGECAPRITSPYSVRGQIISNMNQNTGKRGVKTGIRGKGRLA